MPLVKQKFADVWSKCCVSTRQLILRYTRLLQRVFDLVDAADIGVDQNAALPSSALMMVKFVAPSGPMTAYAERLIWFTFGSIPAEYF